MDIKLRFVNKSSDGNKSEVVIYQKSVLTTMASLSVAWKVIRYCGRDCTHPFVYPDGYEVAITDEYGNYSPRLPAQNGQMLSVVSTPVGNRRLRYTGPASASTELDVLNAMGQGAVNVCIFKDGRLMGMKTSVSPGQKAVFQYQPALWIGVSSEVVQGEPINSAVISDVNTEISLIGIASADIVMTGGGPGEGSTPYEFNLENIVRC
ncbi:hypothetical protein SAMN05216350_10790 [Polaromonas sp. YR568]|uniref:hypothetical protein n=1 Tax=Polaromonas sp. YR568 TaxID=1855301 RepID=UPI0008ECD676|nr:hypothetical protein [Polaromonas sp. YR568]SFU88502.1 hypothetical protein SAMN05216350_10790 [Polaromonas sp. YR568]